MKPDQSRLRVALNIRVAPTLKARIEQYATEMGISVNAAASILLDRGLRADRRDRQQDEA